MKYHPRSKEYENRKAIYNTWITLDRPNIKCNEKDKIRLAGTIKRNSYIQFFTNGKMFYQNTIIVKRNSGKEDFIEFVISEEIFQENDLRKGSFIEIIGEFRTRTLEGNIWAYVFAREITVLEKQQQKYSNSVFLKGTVIENPIHIVTNNGKEIVYFMIEVQRIVGPPYFINCFVREVGVKYVLRHVKIGKDIILTGSIETRVSLQRDKVVNEEAGKMHEIYARNILLEDDYIL